MNVRAGQTVSFIYNAGSHPGTERLIYLETVDGDDLKGIDLRAEDPKQVYRHFKGANVQPGSFTIVADVGEEAIPVESIIAPAFLSQISDPTQIARVLPTLLSGRKGVRYNDRANVVVCGRTDLPRIEVRVADRKTTVDFLNEDGKHVGLELTHSEDYAPGRPIFCPMSADDLRDFAEQLLRNFPLASQTPTSSPGWSDYAAARGGSGGIYGG